MPTIYFAPSLAGVNLTSSNEFDGTGELDIISYTATKISFQDGADILSFVGTGLTYQTFMGQVVDITAGTITGINIKNGTTLNMNWTGLDVSAHTLLNNILDKNWAALNTLMFSTGDTYRMTNNADVVKAFGGNDTVNGNGGNDRIWGGAGRDQLNGGLGNDKLYGEAGNDKLSGGVGLDTLVAAAAMTSSSLPSPGRTAKRPSPISPAAATSWHSRTAPSPALAPQVRLPAPISSPGPRRAMRLTGSFTIRPRVRCGMTATARAAPARP